MGIGDRGLRDADSEKGSSGFGVRSSDSDIRRPAASRPASERSKTIVDFGSRNAESEITPASAIPNPSSPVPNPQSAVHNPQSKNPQLIELRIDELVLEGFSPGDRYRISEAIESELTRLLADQGLSSAPSDQSDHLFVDGGAVQIALDSKPSLIGVRVANAIYRGLIK